MDESSESKETSPAGLFFISATSKDVSRLRRKALDEGTHLAMEIDSHNRGGDNFVWNGVSFNSENVQVKGKIQILVTAFKIQPMYK